MSFTSNSDNVIQVSASANQTPQVNINKSYNFPQGKSHFPNEKNFASQGNQDLNVLRQAHPQITVVNSDSAQQNVKNIAVNQKTLEELKLKNKSQFSSTPNILKQSQQAKIISYPYEDSTSKLPSIFNRGNASTKHNKDLQPQVQLLKKRMHERNSAVIATKTGNVSVKQLVGKSFEQKRTSTSNNRYHQHQHQ